MPILIKQIEANILDHFTTEVSMLTISGLVGEEDYIRLCSLEAFLQNFTKVAQTEPYPTPREFGLLRNKNETFIELEISL